MGGQGRSLRIDLRVSRCTAWGFVWFAPDGEMPLRKRKEAKEKGLSEPDSLWS